MKIDGNEFIRNVGIEQDKERLIQEQNKLEESKRASVVREQNYNETEPKEFENETETAFVDLSIDKNPPLEENVEPLYTNPNSVEDIILDTTNPSNNKKKYIMLGVGLVLLFIITILVIRIMSNSEMENKIEKTDFQKPIETKVAKEDILNKIDSNQEYQKTIDRKNELEEARKLEEKEKKALNDIDVPKEQINNVPLVIDTPAPKEAPKRDLFGLDKENEKVSKTVVKKVVKEKVIPKPKPKVVKKVVKETTYSQPKRKIVVAPPKEKNYTKKSAARKGYFVQIGAFTKAPSNSMIKNIRSKGYDFDIYKLTIKGKMYNKVLIGPYKSRASALENLSQIKKDFKNPSAYILKR